MNELQIEYDSYLDIVTIEGVRFAGDMFRFFSMAKPGQLFRVIEHENGTVTFQIIRSEAIQDYDKAKN